MQKMQFVVITIFWNEESHLVYMICGKWYVVYIFIYDSFNLVKDMLKYHRLV